MYIQWFFFILGQIDFHQQTFTLHFSIDPKALTCTGWCRLLTVDWYDSKSTKIV